MGAAPTSAPGMYVFGFKGSGRPKTLHLVVGPGFRKDTLCGKRIDDTRAWSNGSESLCAKCERAAAREPKP